MILHLQQFHKHWAYSLSNTLCKGFRLSKEFFRHLQGLEPDFKAGMLELPDLYRQYRKSVLSSYWSEETLYVCQLRTIFGNATLPNPLVADPALGSRGIGLTACDDIILCGILHAEKCHGQGTADMGFGEGGRMPRPTQQRRKI